MTGFSNPALSKSVRWIIATIGMVVLVSVYGVWRTIDQKTGGGFWSGALRGALVFGGIGLLWAWAKRGVGKKSGAVLEQASQCAYTHSVASFTPSPSEMPRQVEAGAAAERAIVLATAEAAVTANYAKLAVGIAAAISVAFLGHAVIQNNLPSTLQAARNEVSTLQANNDNLVGTLQDRDRQINAMSKKIAELEVRIADMRSRPTEAPVAKTGYVKEPAPAAKPTSLAKHDPIAEARKELRKAEAICAEIHCSYDDKDLRAWNRVIAAKVALKNALLASE